MSNRRYDPWDNPWKNNPFINPGKQSRNIDVFFGSDINKLEELLKAISQSKDLSAPGEVKTPYEALKHAHPSILLRILALYNHVLATGIVPTACKTASVWMHPKPGKDKNSWDGYRGISLTSVFVKLFERCLLARLAPHFEKSGR